MLTVGGQEVRTSKKLVVAVEMAGAPEFRTLLSDAFDYSDGRDELKSSVGLAS